jgi:hypothetical protein
VNRNRRLLGGDERGSVVDCVAGNNSAAGKDESHDRATQEKNPTLHTVPQESLARAKLSPAPHKVKKSTDRSGLVGTRPFTVPSCPLVQLTTGGSQPCAFAQQLASFVDAGRSIAGLRSKKPLGISLNPVLTHG